MITKIQIIKTLPGSFQTLLDKQIILKRLMLKSLLGETSTGMSHEGLEPP